MPWSLLVAVDECSGHRILPLFQVMRELSLLFIGLLPFPSYMAPS